MRLEDEIKTEKFQSETHKAHNLLNQLLDKMRHDS